MAADAGYDGVGLRAAQVAPELDEAELAKMRTLLDRHGLGVCSLLFRPPPARCVEIACRLGVKVLQACGAPTPEELSGLAAGLDADMYLGLQMHTGADCENVPLAAEYLRRAVDRRAGVIVEPANLMFAGAGHWDEYFFEPLRGRIVGCHLQSAELVDEGPVGLKLRDGRRVCYRRVSLPRNRQIDIRGFLRALRAVGYGGFINVIEPFRPGVNSKVLVAETARALRAAIKEI